MENETSSTGCPLCGETSETLLSEKLRRGEGKVYLCKKCNHGFLDKDNQINFKDYYKDEYRKEYSSRAEASQTNANEIFDVYKRYQTSRLDIIRPHLSKNKKLIDVGCSAGQFIDHIRKEVNTVNGIELDVECCKYVNEVLEIDCDDNYLSESKFFDEKYDIVCSFQVMEHVPNPVTFLSELLSVTNSGGKLFIEVPNLHDPLIKVWQNESYKNFYYHSAHLHYFTEKSLLIVAAKSGIDINRVSFEYTQDYNLLNHLNWLSNNKPQDDCHFGLSDINVKTVGSDTSEWLNEELIKLNESYIKRLKKLKATSNLMMIIDNE